MSKAKRRRQQLRGPDVFQKMGRMWLSSHKTMLFTIIGGVLGFLAFGYGWDIYETSQFEKKSEEIANIVEIYEEETQSFSDAQDKTQTKIDELKAEDEKKKKELKKDQKFTANVEIVQLQKQLDELKVDRAKSLEAFKEYFKKNRMEKTGWYLGARAVSIMVEKEDYAGASDLLSQVLDASKASSELYYKVQLKMMQVSLFEQLGKLDEALAMINEVESNASEGLRSKVLLAKGRINYLKKDTGAARESFSKLLSEHKDSAEATKARALMALMQ